MENSKGPSAKFPQHPFGYTSIASLRAVRVHPGIWAGPHQSVRVSASQCGGADTRGIDALLTVIRLLASYKFSIGAYKPLTRVENSLIKVASKEIGFSAEHDWRIKKSIFHALYENDQWPLNYSLGFEQLLEHSNLRNMFIDNETLRLVSHRKVFIQRSDGWELCPLDPTSELYQTANMLQCSSSQPLAEYISQRFSTVHHAGNVYLFTCETPDFIRITYEIERPAAPHELFEIDVRTPHITRETSGWETGTFQATYQICAAVDLSNDRVFVYNEEGREIQPTKVGDFQVELEHYNWTVINGKYQLFYFILPKKPPKSGTSA